MTVIAGVVFLVAHVLIATEWTHKLLAALGGTAVLLALGVTDSEHAWPYQRSCPASSTTSRTSRP